MTNEHDLNIIKCNIKSQYAHDDEFLGIQLNSEELSVLHVIFDILCFSESWLTDATKQLASF